VTVSDLPPEPADEPEADQLIFDEAFVAGARYQEAPAQDRIARMARISAAHEQSLPWRGDGAAAGSPGAALPPRRRRGRRLLVAVVILAAGAAVVLKPGILPREGPQDAPAPDSLTAPTGLVHGDHRLLPSPVVPAGGTSYQFQHPGAGGLPGVTWNPCDGIHYVVRERGAIPGADAMLRDALTRISAATGLAFVSDGVVSEAPRDDRPAYLPLVYGNTWAPVLITWSDPAESPQLAGDTAGYAQSVSYGERGQPARYVSGSIVLDAPQLSELLRRSNGPAEVESALLHELGHLVGLDHTTDPTQLMFASSTEQSPTVPALGDLHGLALTGQGSCR
jgi:hypothetical protein